MDATRRLSLLLLALAAAGAAAAAPPSLAAAAAAAPPPLLGDSPCCAQLAALNFSSTLPVVVVQLGPNVRAQAPADTPPQMLALQAKGPYLPARLCTCGAPGGGDFGAGLPSKVRVRGSSSVVEYAKKSLALEVLDQAANLATSRGRNARLLGLPADSKWILHGPENDRTLGMRNWLAYWAARAMGRYASRTAFLELFVNAEEGAPLSLSHYQGVYQLHEPVTRGPARVNVSRFDPVGLSGGYMLEYENDNIASTDSRFLTRLSRLQVILAYPHTRNATVLDWINRWADGFEAALLKQPLDNLTAGNWLDAPAAVDYFLATELTKNPDGYRGSIKMHKDRGGPLVMGPVWDYNEAFGLCCGYPINGYKAGGASNGSSGGSAISPEGWRFNICADKGRCVADPLDGISPWYRKLWEDPAFRTLTAARWAALRGPGGPLADAAFTREIARLTALLQEPGARNWQRWSSVLNSNPSYGPAYADWASCFAGETASLQAWLLARLAWMDAALAKQADPAAGPFAYLSPAGGGGAANNTSLLLPAAAPAVPAAGALPGGGHQPAAAGAAQLG